MDLAGTGGGVVGKNCRQLLLNNNNIILKNPWDIYTVDYYSSIKKKKTLPFAIDWVDLENIMLSEINQSEKDQYHRLYSFV